MIEDIRKKIFEYIPTNYFVENLIESKIGHIKIAILRETINPFINRSTDPEATITFQMDENREVIEIPPRKFKSKEKLLGLKMCREVGVVDEGVRYNMIKNREQLGNPNSILFGDSVTQEREAAGLSSRAIYDWSYSLRDVKDITDKLQHNALSEEGTMWDEEKGTQRQSLFMIEYILPGTFFPHFITLENVTPELLIHLLYCVLNEKRYGAQTTTNAQNFENKIIGIYFDEFEKPLNSYVISKTWGEKDVSKQEIITTVTNLATQLYSNNNILAKERLIEFINLVESFWKEKEKLKAIYKKAKEDSVDYLKTIGMIKEKK